MEDTFATLVGVMLSVFLLILLPLYNMFERQDDIAYEYVLKTTTQFTDEIRYKGYCSYDMYNKLLDNLVLSGNMYDISVEAHKQIYNKSKDGTIVTNTEIDYTNQFLNVLSNTRYEASNPIYVYMMDSDPNYYSNLLKNSNIKSRVYLLNVGDYIYVKLKNSNITQATIFFNMVAGDTNPIKINIGYGGRVNANEWKIL